VCRGFCGRLADHVGIPVWFAEPELSGYISNNVN
jgi:hypothetical protein